MAQLPAPLRCTVRPLTVQFPFAANETASPEVAAALTVKSGSPKFLSASGPKVIVWLAFAKIGRASCREGGLLVASAACLEVMVQLPVAVRCTVAPLTVQLPLARKPTRSPEDA